MRPACGYLKSVSLAADRASISVGASRPQQAGQGSPKQPTKDETLKRALAGLGAVLTLLVLQVSTADAATVWAVGDGGDSLTNDDALASRIQSSGPFDKFLYLGDVYEYGTAEEWANYYDPSFGRFKSISSPTPGNHEWGNRASGYDPYWGSRAPQNGGGHYYSFDIAGWHVVSLNSQEDTSATSPQVAWLRQDLAKYPGTCTIATWHRPRYSAAANLGGDYALEPLWAELANHSVATLVGHHHDYQRMTPNRGITQFVAGGGGHLFHSVDSADTRLVSYNDTSYGALKMDLQYGKMDFQYVLTNGSVHDQGTIPCTPHGPPPPNSPPSAAFDYSPQNPKTSDPVSFTSSSSDPDGTIASQAWDLDNNGQYDDATGATASRRFATAGTYTVGLEVTDDKGAVSTTSRTLTVGNQAPSASFAYSPSAPLRRELVSFSSTSADPDGTIASQAWDLDNDGRFDDATGGAASRSWKSAGSYTVSLRVVDNAGAASIASRSVTVYRSRPAGAATLAAALTRTKRGAPTFTRPGRKLVLPRVQIRGPRPAKRYRRQPKVLYGRSKHTAKLVRLTLLRRVGRRCASFDSRRFRRSSCRSRRTFVAGMPKRGRWRFRLPLDLRRGAYTLTARARASNGRLAAQTVRFRVKARVKVRKAPPAVSHEEYKEGVHP